MLAEDPAGFAFPGSAAAVLRKVLRSPPRRWPSATASDI